MKKGLKLISVKEYATKHNMTVQNVYYKIKKGQIEIVKVGNVTLICQ